MKASSFRQYIKSKISAKYILSLGLLSQIHFSAFAAEKMPEAEPSVLSNPLFLALSVIIILLAILIVIFNEMVKAGVHLKLEQKKAKTAIPEKVVKSVVLLLLVGACSNPLFAENVVTPAVKDVSTSVMGLNTYVFYIMISLIIVELFAATFLYIISMRVLGVWELKQKMAKEKASLKVSKVSLIEKLNASVAIDEEAEIMLDHNYDGIRELDNDLPPWWKYGFYLTIVVAAIYMIHYHVSNTGKLQLEEYESQLAKGKLEVEAYRKKAANLVDENNVTALTDNTSLTAGKLIFTANCSACHGQAGEGNGVGPNLTDDYWLHNGSIKDIFRSIKLGWPEKGMKSWEKDLGAKQIHEVSSYIKSLKGTNPANAKEKQGELFIEENTGDTMKAKDAKPSE